MRRRGYTVTIHCKVQGCTGSRRYEADTRRDESRIWREYSGKVECDFHCGLEHRLLPERPERSVRMANERKPSGVYFGGSHRFCYGPGFEVYSKDWPDGAVLEVTARVFVPSMVSRTQCSECKEPSAPCATCPHIA